VNEPDVRQALRDWIRATAGEGTSEVEDTTPLIASGLITSLQVMSLLLYIEELRQDPIDPASLRPGVFRDIDTIYATFFNSDADGVPPTGVAT